MWASVYVRPLRGVPLEVRLVDDKIAVTASANLDHKQAYLLDEYRKEVSKWYDYFVAQNP